MTNQELMRKADWSVGDLTADGGLLTPEQANQFIRKLLVQPTLLRVARTVTMSSPQRQINKIQFADRILMPATSGVALDPDTSPTNRRSKPTGRPAGGFRAAHDRYQEQTGRNDSTTEVEAFRLK